VYLGIEIGGTKLQLGVGADDGKLAALWRASVDVAAGPEGIRRQITAGVPELLERANLDRSRLRGVGIGFGGPVDDSTRTIIKSHQIDGWDGFPLADWIADITGLPAALGNDADVAGLAEALHGAGKGLSPIFFITVGSGIGGGFIIDGEIYRGVGRGAAEIGHLWTRGPWGEFDMLPLEEVSSGWAIQRHVQGMLHREESKSGPLDSPLFQDGNHSIGGITTKDIACAAAEQDSIALDSLARSWDYLSEGICNVIALLCPRRIVIGGGVSLMGEELFFDPLRTLVADRVFRPFAGLTDIVPAALGEEVVVHGAIALARKRFG
jgi:glucokinase